MMSIRHEAGMHDAYTWMGAYGAECAEPTRLHSSEKWVSTLARARPTHNFNPQEKGLYNVSKRAGGSSSVTRGEALKRTQAYPPQFGVAVC